MKTRCLIRPVMVFAVALDVFVISLPTTNTNETKTFAGQATSAETTTQVDISSQDTNEKHTSNTRALARDLDLSHWKLTLPTNRDGDYAGHPAEVLASELEKGFRNAHFYRDAKGALVFWCPVNGATTEGTDFPRSELREMLAPEDPAINWTATGTHTLRATCRVIQVPSNPKVVIGQIHGYSGKARPLVKLQYFKGRIEALVKSSPTKGKDIKLTWPDVGLNSKIEYEIKVQDEVLSLMVNGTTQTQNLRDNDPRWMNETFYFKAGVYPQDNEGPLSEGPSSEGARVSFSDLRISHELK